MRYSKPHLQKRDGKGRFIKGQRPSPATEFKPGQHWRPRKPYWDKTWLEREYIENLRPASDIAQEWGITENAILFWLAKHGIPRRTMKEIRAEKHWGNTGEDNPMWKGGITSEGGKWQTKRNLA